MVDNALGFTPLQASSLTPYLTVATATGEYYSQSQIQTIITKIYNDIVNADGGAPLNATSASYYWNGV